MSLLYTIENLQNAGGSITATVKLNAAHVIFEGHFPSQPVLPGACMLDMIKDITSAALGENFRLIKAENVKFITPVDPSLSAELHVTISYTKVAEGLKVKALLSNPSPCMKMDGLFGQMQ